MSTSPNSLADLSRLEPLRNDTLQVVIETPRGSRNKYAYDGERRCFQLKKVLPAGMVFPYDFGFVPGTKGGDGDELDALVLMDEPGFPGCVVAVRPIGIILGENTDLDGKTYRNDRLITVAMASEAYAGVEQVRDMPTEHLRRLEAFFESYPRLLGDKEYRVLGTEGPEPAKRLIEEARKAAE